MPLLISVTTHSIKVFYIYSLRGSVTSRNDMLSFLKHVIHKRWPTNVHQLDQKIQQYWNFYEQIKTEDGITLINKKTVIPDSLHHEMLHKNHEGHLGIKKCKAHAKSVVYRLLISNDIKNIKYFDACLKYNC